MLVLPRVLETGEKSGSLDTTHGSFGSSGLIGGSEGPPEDVLAEQSSTAFVQGNDIPGT